MNVSKRRVPQRGQPGFGRREQSQVHQILRHAGEHHCAGGDQDGRDDEGDVWAVFGHDAVIGGLLDHERNEHPPERCHEGQGHGDHQALPQLR